MKKKFLYIAAIIICLAIITGNTLAYFTASDIARNVITSGGVQIELVEQQLVNGILQPYPNQPIKIMPATTVSKIVSIENKDQTAWIRINYTITAWNENGDKMDATAAELEAFVVVKPDTVNWIWKDGWWYYSEPVRVGETTKPLFEEVEFSGLNMGNQYQGCTVRIDVSAQAVQQANNGSTVMEAAGWPAE